MEKQTPARQLPRGRVGFGAPRLLIVGCGDIGLRIVARLRDRFRIVALTASATRVAELRGAGTVPVVGNLDERASLARLRAFGARVIHLAPPPNSGRTDPRTRRLRSVLNRPQRAVYVSTTGVYGDAGGGWIAETARLAPRTERALRRLDAERAMRAVGSSVLRVPGIYALDRLPLERLRNGVPAVRAEDDIYTNHIHADDLARIAIAALFRARPRRVYNAVDDSESKLGDYFDLVADRFGLPRPPRLPRKVLEAAVSPVQYSFMSESRRVRNQRMKRELKVRLRFPSVEATLASTPPQASVRATPLPAIRV
jgi:nucleoside-diphosphate-sugar epimerase